MPLACDGGNFSSPATHPDCGTPALTVEPGLVIQVGFFITQILQYATSQVRNEETRRSGFVVELVEIKRDDVWLS